MKKHRFTTYRKIIRDCTAVLFGLAMILPQSFDYGRPKTVLAAFILWTVFSLDRRFVNTIKKMAIPVLFLLLFLMVVWLNLRMGNVGYCRLVVAGPIYTILVVIVAGHYQIHFPDHWRLIRCWLLILIAIFTVQTIPELIASPRISRVLTGGTDNSLSAHLYQHGFLGYPQLYALSIPFATFIVLFFSIKSVFFKYFLFASIVIISSILLLSTLTLVAVCFLVGVFAFLAHNLFYAKSSKKIALLFLALVLIVSIELIAHLLGSQFEPVDFILKKGVWILTGVADSGSWRGDPTGRGKMFFSSLNVFLENPLFGTGFTDKTWRIGGHSSFMDNWAFFGIIGNFPIFMVQFLLSWAAFSNWRASPEDMNRAAHCIAWFLYWLVSILNTATFNVMPILLLFVDFLPKRYQNNATGVYLKEEVVK